MKKILLIALALFVTFSLCACKMGSDNDEPTSSIPSTTVPVVTNPTILDPTIIDPTILDPTFETNVPDSNVDDEHLMDPTEDPTQENAPKIRSRITGNN